MTEVGTSKLEGDPGLHNKPLGCGASDVYASGPDSEEEEEEPASYSVIKGLKQVCVYVCACVCTNEDACA